MGVIPRKNALTRLGPEMRVLSVFPATCGPDLRSQSRSNAPEEPGE